MKIGIKKSGIIIIGNEILNGKTIEKNSNFLCKKLSDRGIEVKEIVIIPDEKENIIEKVNSFRKKFEYVFTTGGIGPTHDDITSESIAEAFNVRLELNLHAKKILKEHYSDEAFTKARLKMAYLPKNASLIYNPVSIAPGFFLENVYVFPGVPKILEIMFVEFIKTLEKGKKKFQVMLSTILSEGLIGEFVGQIQKQNLNVEIGSYPYFKKKSFGVTLVIRGYDKRSIDNVAKKIFDYVKLKKGKPKLF